MRTFKKLFATVFGMALMIIPFYAPSLNMLLLSEKSPEWTNAHKIMLACGVIFFTYGLSGVKFLADGVKKIITFIVTKKTSGEKPQK